MRLLTVTPFYHPAIAYGGLVPLIHGCSRELVNRGHEVVVYTTDALNGTDRQPEAGNAPVIVDGVKVHYFPNLSNALAYGARAFLPAGMILRALREVQSFDIIHLHDVYTLPNVLISHCARWRRVPFVISPHGSYPPLLQRGRLVAKRIFLALFGRSLLSDAARMVVTSEPESAHCIAAGQPPAHIVNVRSGVPADEFSPLPPRGTYRDRLGIARDAVVILFFGRVDPVKGLDLLLPALRDLSSDRPPHLIIAGPDFGSRAALEVQARQLGITERVHFLPLISGALARRQLFADADLFCLPSRSEGFPVSILEMMAAGLPGVVSDACNFPALAAADAGSIVPLNHAALVAGLRELTTSEARRAQVGAAARRLIESEFRLEHMVDRLERLYTELSARGARAP